MSEPDIKLMKNDSDVYQNDNKCNKLTKNKMKMTTSHGYFHAHECHLDADKLSAYKIEINFFKRFFFNIISVRTSDIRAMRMYKSYAALCAEKLRHYNNHPFTIHPFSILRLYLEVLQIIVVVLFPMFLAVHYSKPNYVFMGLHRKIVYFCDVILIINIIAKFLTGYVTGFSSKSVVLDLRKIAFHYLKSWLLLDILSSLSFVPHIFGNSCPFVYLMFDSAKLLQLPSAIRYLQNILNVVETSIQQNIILEIIFSIVLYLSWNIYLQFSVEYALEGTYYPTNPRQSSWLTYGKLWNSTLPVRFIYSLDRAVGMLTTNINMSIIEQTEDFELFLITWWLVSKLLLIHFAMKYIIVLFGSETARTKYYIMQKQVEHYMVQKKYPKILKKKILKFYAIRYQMKYFRESHMLNAVSGQLHNDILMHSGRQLVRELDLLKLLPRSLITQIVFKLRLVILIAGDIIFKINTIGDCLYFIDKGTVAMYSESGQEVCHYEDGEIFGEVALIMKHHFRTTSTVAVTNCELFRLERKDFETTIACYPMAYENIKKMAINTFETTCVLDEHHKADLRMGERSDYGHNL